MSEIIKFLLILLIAFGQIQAKSDPTPVPASPTIPIENRPIQNILALGNLALSGTVSFESQAKILDQLIAYRKHLNFDPEVINGKKSGEIDQLEKTISQLYSRVQMNFEFDCEESTGHYGSTVKESSLNSSGNPSTACEMTAFDENRQAHALRRELELGTEGSAIAADGPPRTLPQPSPKKIDVEVQKLARGKTFIDSRHRFTRRGNTPEELKELRKGVIARYQFRERVFYKALENSLKTAITLALSNLEQPLTDTGTRERKVRSIIASACSLNKCTPGDQELLFRNLEPFSKTINSSEASELKHLNEKIANLNTKLEEYKGKPCYDGLEITPDEEKSLRQYQDLYQQIASQGVGTLLLTDEMQDGPAQNTIDPNRSNQKMRKLTVSSQKNGRSKSYVPYKGKRCAWAHPPISMQKYKKAVKEAKKRNLEHLNSILKISGSTDLDDSNTRDLYRYNPVAVGQVLAEAPEFSSIACSQLKAVRNIDRNNERGIKTALWGGLIVGTVLLAPITLGIATGSSALLAFAGNASIAAGAATTGIATTGAINFHGRHEDRLDQLITGQGSEHTVEEAQRLNAEYEEYLMEATISGTFSAIDAAAFLKGLSQRKLAQTLSDSERTILSSELRGHILPPAPTSGNLSPRLQKGLHLNSEMEEFKRSVKSGNPNVVFPPPKDVGNGVKIHFIPEEAMQGKFYKKYSENVKEKLPGYGDKKFVVKTTLPDWFSEGHLDDILQRAKVLKSKGEAYHLLYSDGIHPPIKIQYYPNKSIYPAKVQPSNPIFLKATRFPILMVVETSSDPVQDR
jgi:hypothetical protein